MKEQHLQIGVIADDFTGAGDAAAYLRKGGFSVRIMIYPFMEDAGLADCDAVVIALKSRSQQADAAVRDSLKAAEWLKKEGAGKLYFKYCSTFDSTPEGNIGPVADALLEMSGQGCSILCPAMLDNGRSVENGVLYVNGVPLGESHMKHHPLNPMWASSIVELMRPQSRYPAFVLTRAEMEDAAVLAERLRTLGKAHRHFYLVPDHRTPEDGKRIAERFEGLALWTGGSELLLHFAERRSACCTEEPMESKPPLQKSGRLMFCGSCSEMTQKQVHRWLACGGKGRMITPEDGAESEQELQDMADEYLQDPAEDFLFYSSGSVGMRDTESSDAAASAAVESALSRLAAIILEKAPVERLIVAGGETSGAVTKALGLHVFSVGASVAPGVPSLYPQDRPQMQVVLKSGNFGGEDFFLTALNDGENEHE